MAIVTLLLAFLTQGDVQLGQQVNLRSPDDGHRLAVKPPAGDFRIEVVVNCQKPGVVLDSVGINAAPTGSYSLTVNPDRKVSFQVWQPGWTVLTSTQALGTKDEIIVVSRTGERVTLTLGGQSIVGTIKAPLSRDPLWIGDFPGDDSWGANYRIHPAMVGTVRVVGVAPMVASPDLVVDETGTVSAVLKARITKALEGVNAQTGGRLYVLFSTAQNVDDTLAAATRLREAQQAAHPGVPLGVLSYSPSGRGYSRTNSFDAKINFEQVKAAWAATEGSLLAEHAAQQIEHLAGQRSPTTTTTPPALIGEAKIGPEGGKVASQTGDFEVSIPSGALAETQTVKVTQLNGGNHGRIVDIEAGGKLLAKPATITYRLPDNVDASTVVAAGHVTESLWSVHPSQYNPATRTLTAKTNHFSNQGWFGMNKKQHQVAGAVTYSLTGTILIHVSTTALLGSAAVVSAPVVAVVAIFAAVGWFAGGTEYETLMKQGFKGPIPADGFSVYWKPDQVTAKGEAVVLVNKKTNKILTWVKDTDQWAPVGQGGTFTIEVPSGEKLTLEDIGSYKVPTAVVNLATDLSTTKRWYETNRFNPPANLPVLVTNDVDKLPTGEKNAGEFEGTFLKVNGELLTDAKASSNVVRATIAHEYFHAVVKHNGFKEQFLGSEEAVATAVESIVWPGANDGLTTNGWNVAGPVLANGLKGTGQGEGFSSPERRGYVLWSIPKYVYHAHSADDLKAIAAGTMPDGLLQQMFRAYVRSLTNREDSLDKEIESEDGRGKIATGWPVTITNLALGTNTFNVSPGKVDVPLTPALAVRAIAVKLPASTPPAPIVVRRRSPLEAEEISVLRPKASFREAVSSDERGRDGVITEASVVATPRDWDTGELMLPVLLSSAKGREGTGNPLYVYRLIPPPTFESVGASDGFHLKWSLPTLNGVPPGDALWGYWIYGRMPGGEVRLLQELRFRPDQSPNGLSGRGGSRNAGTIPVTTVEYVLPSVAGSLFESFGIASVELVAQNGDIPLVSDIQWAGAPADDLLKELQKSTQIIVSIAGVTEVKTDDNPGMRSGVSNLLKVATFGYPNTVDAILGVAKSYDKPVAAPKLSWSGAAFTLTLDVGPHQKTSTSREGTSVSHATRNIIIRGQYDPKRRMIGNVTATYKSLDTGDFTPDPNWKPRSTVEALMGGPKASKTLNRMSITITLANLPLTQSVKDQAGNTWIQFSMKANTPIPSCYGEYEMEFTQTGQPNQKKLHRINAGPPTVGVPVYPPEVGVAFVIMKG
ncbi:MAG: hypothetical protein IT363_14205 [Methanoregulaceae archaeon]|nr:hypothetical protein [Methanoregulaceae archaeon]